MATGPRSGLNDTILNMCLSIKVHFEEIDYLGMMQKGLHLVQASLQQHIV